MPRRSTAPPPRPGLRRHGCCLGTCPRDPKQRSQFLLQPSRLSWPPVGRLLLLRHAESTWNHVGRWQGWADPPLSPDGEAQVRAAAGRLAAEPPFEMVATSDLCRARRTAELLAGELGIDGGLAVDAGLREYDVARWSGLTYEQIEAGWPGELERFRRGEVSPPDGEDRFEFDARVAAAGRRVGMLAAKAGGARLLV
ncbi:MAG: histidine phosphatase family protein, partial [Acidimicrobiales bacterium]